MIHNIICTFYNFCFAFKSEDYLKTHESSQTFTPFLKNAYLQNTSVFGPSWSLMKWVGVGSSTPSDTQTQVSPHRLSAGFNCLRISKASVTPEASGLGRDTQAHKQLQEDLVLLRLSLVSLQGCFWCPEAPMEPTCKQLSTVCIPATGNGDTRLYSAVYMMVSNAEWEPLRFWDTCPEPADMAQDI